MEIGVGIEVKAATIVNGKRGIARQAAHEFLGPVSRWAIASTLPTSRSKLEIECIETERNQRVLLPLAPIRGEGVGGEGENRHLRSPGSATCFSDHMQARNKNMAQTPHPQPLRGARGAKTKDMGNVEASAFRLIALLLWLGNSQKPTYCKHGQA